METGLELVGLTLSFSSVSLKSLVFNSCIACFRPVDWLRSLPQKQRTKCLALIRHLHNFGHELRRPYADYFRDGIYELRIAVKGVNCRILYFLYGQAAVFFSHGLINERFVPPVGIDRDVDRKSKFEQDPQARMFLRDGSS